MVKDGTPMGTKVVISYDGDTPFGFGTVLDVKNGRALLMTAGVVAWFDAARVFTTSAEPKSKDEESPRANAGDSNGRSEKCDGNCCNDCKTKCGNGGCGCGENNEPFPGLGIKIKDGSGKTAYQLTDREGNKINLHGKSRKMFERFTESYLHDVEAIILLNAIFSHNEDVA